MSFFLKLSNLQKNHQKTEEQIIYLGPWSSNLEDFILDSKQYLVTYNLNVTKQLKLADYANKVISYLLKELAKELNKYHNKNFKFEFWQILLSNWLTMVINCLHQVYVGLEKTNSLNKKIFTTVDSFFPYQYLYQPKTNSGSIIDDRYLHSIASFLIEFGDFPNINYRQEQLIQDGHDTWFGILEKKNTEKGIISNLKKILFKHSQKIWKRDHLIYNYETTDIFKLLKLKLSVKNIEFSFKEFQPKIKKRKKNISKIHLKESEDPFVNLVKKFIEINLPITVLEEFNTVIESSCDYKGKISAMGSSGFYSDWQLFEIALVKENGGKTISFEEGCSSFYKNHSMFNFVFKPHDYFFSWSKINLATEIENIEITPLRFNFKSVEEKRNDKILYYPAPFALAPDIYSTHNYPNHYQYFADKISIIKEIRNKNLLEKLIVKPKQAQFLKQGEDDNILMKKHDIDYIVKVDRNVNIQNCGFFIIDHISSGLIEALYHNTPFSMFLNFDITLPSDSLMKYINKLEKNKMFFSNKEELVAHLAANYEDRENFWKQKNIQDTRKFILNELLTKTNNWEKSMELAYQKVEKDYYENK